MINANVLTTTRIDYEVLQDVTYSQIASLLKEVSPLYPNFDAWLAFKFFRGLKSDGRKVAVAHDGDQILGAALLKTQEENKICTFYVLPEFRDLKIGSNLMSFALSTFGSESVSITVSDERLDELSPLLKSKGFELTSSHKDLYRTNISEHFFTY